VEVKRVPDEYHASIGYLRSRYSFGNPLDPAVESISLEHCTDEEPCIRMLHLLSRALHVYVVCVVCFMLLSIDVCCLLLLALCF
jgi:hypothetical protein